MKIAIVIHAVTKNSGQGHVIYALAKYLAKKGHEIHLFANSIDRDLQKVNGIMFHFIPSIHFTYLLKGITFLMFAFGKINKCEYDILHFNGAVKLGSYDVNTCHFVHDAWAKASRQFNEKNGLRQVYYYIFTWFNARLERLIYYRRKGTIVAVSNKIKDELVEMGINPNRLTVIYNGVDTKRFNSFGKLAFRKRLAKEFGFGLDDFIVLSIGDSTGRKGLECVLGALGKLKDAKVKLIVVGNVNRLIFTEKIRINKIEGRVKFSGFRDDMERIYKGADVFVFPTRYDPCPLIVLEAMASSLPVIVPKPSICGASELIKNMVNGILLENVSDADEIASKIKLLTNDKDLRQRLSEEAQKTAERNSWHRMAEQYESLYYSLVSKKDRIVGENSWFKRE